MDFGKIPGQPAVRLIAVLAIGCASLAYGRQISASGAPKRMGEAPSRAHLRGGSAGAPSASSDKRTAAEPGKAPPGMVWIPGGEFWMGSDEPMFQDARPVHKVYVDGFWMDRATVTNEQFAKFVKATGYVTAAERPADPS